VRTEISPEVVIQEIEPGARQMPPPDVKTRIILEAYDVKAIIFKRCLNALYVVEDRRSDMEPYLE